MFMLCPSRRRSLTHYHIGTLLSVKQLEGEFATNFLILPVCKAGKQAKIKNMRTNAIPYFQIRFQVRYYQCIQIQTFVQDILVYFIKWRSRRKGASYVRCPRIYLREELYQRPSSNWNTPPISSLQPIGRLERRKLAKSTKYSSF